MEIFFSQERTGFERITKFSGFTECGFSESVSFVSALFNLLGGSLSLGRMEIVTSYFLDSVRRFQKIKLRFVAAKAASFSKQEFYEESYSPELAFCDLYAQGYLRETSDKSVDLENPESYYLGTFFPSKLERKNLPLWLQERNLFPNEFQWKSSSKEQVLKILNKEIRFQIENEIEGSFDSEFIQVGGKRFLLKSDLLKGRFFQRAVFTIHPMVFAKRILKGL